jgi:RimJ/RimL family protein N-acetyltransferase
VVEQLGRPRRAGDRPVIEAADVTRLSVADLPPSTMVTERLDLTPLTADDAEEMVAVLADESMYEFTGGGPPTLAQLGDRYRRLVVGHSDDGSELWFNWIVRRRSDAAPVGVMQATVAADRSTADVAWEVGVPWQRQGIASEAAAAVVTWLVDHGVVDIRACIHPRHDASGRVAANAGLTRTTEFVDGEIVWRRPRAG